MAPIGPYENWVWGGPCWAGMGAGQSGKSIVPASECQNWRQAISGRASTNQYVQDHGLGAGLKGKLGKLLNRPQLLLLTMRTKARGNLGQARLHYPSAYIWARSGSD